MQAIAQLSGDVKQYLIITGNYWAFTLTDGALRMLVILHFHQLGYSPLEIALLFVFYEVFGIITNLIGGWLGAIIGLNNTMQIGLVLQIIALSMLLVPAEMLSIIWVMIAQALSGIAKDLNKMSAKSAIKLLIPETAQNKLYKWVALLTGSKNTLKGAGFFLGGALLSTLGFHDAILAMVVGLAIVCVLAFIFLKKDLGRASIKPKFKQLFSNQSNINCLSAARLFLFAARDVWFVVALPVYLNTTFGWDYWSVGAFLAGWVVIYGGIQSIAPKITGPTPDGRHVFKYTCLLSIIPMVIALALQFSFQADIALLLGLGLFGVVFAINSSIHSYLIVSYAKKDGVSMDVGFYYMANATGRLLGTLFSGWVFQSYGFEACLWISSLLILLSSVISYALPHRVSTSTHC